MHIAIVGFGAVGRETAKRLTARGDSVRVVQRKPPAALPEGVTFLAADVLDRDSLRAACAEAESIVCCLGFPYDSRVWEAAWPRSMDNLLTVCAERKARFVFADNLYMSDRRIVPWSRTFP